MKIIDKIIESRREPLSKHVLWKDDSERILKMFSDGSWKPVASSSSEDETIDGIKTFTTAPKYGSSGEFIYESVENTPILEPLSTASDWNSLTGGTFSSPFFTIEGVATNKTISNNLYIVLKLNNTNIKYVSIGHVSSYNYYYTDYWLDTSIDNWTKNSKGTGGPLTNINYDYYSCNVSNTIYFYYCPYTLELAINIPGSYGYTTDGHFAIFLSESNITKSYSGTLTSVSTYTLTEDTFTDNSIPTAATYTVNSSSIITDLNKNTHLAKVASTGSYNDLVNKPTIPEGLPSYTSADNGKVLQIVNGKATWVTLS